MKRTIPGDEAIFCSKARDCEGLGRLICERWRQDGGCRTWILQHYRGHIYKAPAKKP